VACQAQLLAVDLVLQFAGGIDRTACIFMEVKNAFDAVMFWSVIVTIFYVTLPTGRQPSVRAP
jgi:hypothetical protein